jgi:hypothetical protein
MYFSRCTKGDRWDGGDEEGSSKRGNSGVDSLIRIRQDRQNYPSFLFGKLLEEEEDLGGQLPI